MVLLFMPMVVFTTMYVYTIDIEVSRLAIRFQKASIIKHPHMQQYHPQVRVADNTSTGSILFKQYFHKSCKTYQLTNQSACTFKPTKFLI